VSEAASEHDVEASSTTANNDAGEDPAGRAGSAAPASRAEAVLAYLASQLVAEPDEVRVVAEPGRRGTALSLFVAPGDMGKVIGRRGRVAQSIRTVVRAAGALDGQDVSVDIVD
jgi:predicted RNA-binding protein YlqC (UPF0109 family)